jgi:AcrR family transcriptional regulator
MEQTPVSDTRSRILDAAFEQLRRHGPAKTGVVDVARAVGLSHAAVYRHFASKADLFDAVAERWLAQVSEPLDAIVTAPGPAAERLEAWLLTLARAKRQKLTADPELFESYRAIAEAAHGVVAAHIAKLRADVAAIIADGMAAGEFAAGDPQVAAATVLDATLRFHHPHFVRESIGQPIEDDLRRVVRLLIAGLRAASD